jgi:ssDNA-binding replication factor A large subunit
MSDINAAATEIEEQFNDHIDVSVEEIEADLQKLVQEYSVPLDEATRTIRERYKEENGVAEDDLYSPENEQVAISEVPNRHEMADDDGEWVDLEVKLVELWEPRADSIGQVGLIGDETGTTKFTAWAKSDLPTLEEGESYRLSSVVTDKFDGNYSVKLNSATDVETLDEEIEVGEETKSLSGALVSMQNGSGLIKRCDEEDCSRVLQDGRCKKHGEQDGTFDLRIKGILDTGDSVEKVLLDAELIEDLTGVTIEGAVEEAMDALDTEVVQNHLEDMLIGRYFEVEGSQVREYLVAETVEQLSSIDAGPGTDAESQLVRARSL